MTSKARGPVVGMMPVARYETQEVGISPPARLYLFSDGVYEITRPDGSVLEYAQFQEVLGRPSFTEMSDLDALLRFARDTQGSSVLEDDFSILRLEI